MKVYTLDIDSSERDPILYPNQNSYIIELKNPVYNISKIKLLSAKIPNSQLIINSTNNTFSIDNTEFNLTNTNYSNGFELASDLELIIGAPQSNVSSVTFDPDTNSLLFSNTGTSTNSDPTPHPFSLQFYSGLNGYTSEERNKTTPHQVLGFTGLDYNSNNGIINSGYINLNGPNDIILRISSGSDDFNKSVYSNIPYYTGRILTTGDFINYYGSDNPIEYTFRNGEHKTLQHLKFDFFYMSHGRLIPYDFRNQDHVLKLELECSLSRLEDLPPPSTEILKMPPPISIPEYENPYKWKEYIYISIIIIIGSLLMMLVRPKRISE